MTPLIELMCGIELCKPASARQCQHVLVPVNSLVG